MTSEPPAISPPANAGGPRPFWSVMVPTYQPREALLRQTLESVLNQDPGPDQMQIEVVDDCSPDSGVASLVKSIGKGRVSFSSTPQNSGLAGCWNTCIHRAAGQWVHILHHDDFVLPGFYDRLAKAASLRPEFGLLATRSFYVDADGVILDVSVRLPNLENGGKTVDDFFYATPIQCPGIVVKRSSYETRGGFRSDLAFTLDCEMWTRIISSDGGLVTSEVLACYRKFGPNETGRLVRSGEALRDLDRLNHLFAERHPAFDSRKARRRVCHMAIDQAERFSISGDSEAAKANFDYWRGNAPASLRLRRLAGRIARGIFPRS